MSNSEPFVALDFADDKSFGFYSLILTGLDVLYTNKKINSIEDFNRKKNKLKESNSPKKKTKSNQNKNSQLSASTEEEKQKLLNTSLKSTVSVNE